MEQNNVFIPNPPTYLSNDIAELAAALSEFQGMVVQPKLNKEVKVDLKGGCGYRFKYADLAECIKSAAPALKATGLSVTQIPIDSKLITLLIHKSGQWIKSEVLLPQQTADYKSFGSAITYLKRYTYCAILGIVADSDDDASYAQGDQYVKNDISKKSSNSSIVQRAIAEIAAISNIDQYNDLWNKWAASNPEICQNGSPFWNAMVEKNKQLNNQ